MIPDYFISVYRFSKISPTRCALEVEKNTMFICICKQIHTIKIKNKDIPVYRVIWDDETFIVFSVKRKHYMIEENCVNENRLDIKKIIMEV